MDICHILCFLVTPWYNKYSLFEIVNQSFSSSYANLKIIISSGAKVDRSFSWKWWVPFFKKVDGSNWLKVNENPLTQAMKPEDYFFQGYACNTVYLQDRVLLFAKDRPFSRLIRTKQKSYLVSSASSGKSSQIFSIILLSCIIGMCEFHVLSSTPFPLPRNFLSSTSWV